MSTESRTNRQYSPEQRNAILDAIFDGGMSNTAAALSAERGELPHNSSKKLPPYTVPKNTVSRWRTDARAEREQSDPRKLVAEGLDRVLRIANTELRAEADKARGDRDMGKLKATTDTLQRALQLADSLADMPKGATPDHPTPEPAEPQSLADQLAEKAAHRDTPST